jgi:hypothetical protein
MMIVKPWMITFYRLEEEGNSIHPKVANKDDATTLLRHKATQSRAQIDKVLLSTLTTITKEKNKCIPPSSKNQWVQNRTSLASQKNWEQLSSKHALLKNMRH